MATAAAAAKGSTGSSSHPIDPELEDLVLINLGAEDTSPPLPLTVADVPKSSHLSGPHSLNPHYGKDLRDEGHHIDPKAAAKAKSAAKKKQKGMKPSEMNSHFAAAM